ncbi:UNVERIFIED_CONTAM: LEAF RUST 10 DISEASE-RESISTANCE LOCUS RECEPTOR-LIKE PROTEIN KINASE-like 2.2 [Sesamum radiatum]|uniref:LEAF RUST 10 DISEASE-RESISTANCE LOCUS RECEPTOR-LIKE PROTEIN KINASE-like 2.2 n=1 Tax=Sesamum radiatum TaxID=300843 RepID=A0AAW2THU3_SESRA
MSCPPEKLTTLNSLASPFEVEALGYSEGFVLFNCSNAESDWRTVSCLSNHDHKVITVASTDEITALPPHSSCFKMYNISYVPYNALTGRDDEYGERFYLRWRKPSCGNCEAEGMFCRLRNNETAEDTECFSPEQPQHGSSKNYKSLVADIKRITDNFKEKLGQQTLFKGMLVDETRVAVKMIDSEQNVEDFIDDVDTIESQTHMLGWETLHRVALGVAKGIDYVRQVCNQNILSLDINPQNILLDDNFNPKVLLRHVLLDVVGKRSGREKENGGIYFPEWILKNGAERAIQIDEEEKNEIVKKLSVVGLWCIQWFPSDRPSMKTVIQMLEGDNKRIMRPNPFASFNLKHT